MGLGSHPGDGAETEHKEACWHHLVGAWVGQPDTGPTIGSQHAQEGSSEPPFLRETEAQELK